MDNIERAVEVLTDPLTLPKKGPKNNSREKITDNSPKRSPLNN